MSRLGLLGLVVLAGCGGTPSRSRATARPAPARAALVEPGARFDLERVVQERLDGRLAATRREIVYLAIGDRAPDGTYTGQALLVVIEGTERVGRILYDLRLAPDLTLRGDPIERCEDLPDELAPERALRHMLGAAPRSDTYWSDLRETPLVAEVHAGDAGRVRAEALLALADDPISGVLATGPARVRVIAEVDHTGLVGEVRTRLDARATVREPGGDRVAPGVIRVDERITGFRAAGPIPAGESCERTGDFDARQVTAAIRTRQDALRACYEVALREDPTLEGSLHVRLTIQMDGSVTGVRVTELTMQGPQAQAVADCVARVIAGFRFTSGPQGGSVTYTFPFVFSPHD